LIIIELVVWRISLIVLKFLLWKRLKVLIIIVRHFRFHILILHGWSLLRHLIWLRLTSILAVIWRFVDITVYVNVLIFTKMCVLCIRSILGMGIINIRLAILHIKVWGVVYVTILDIVDGCLMRRLLFNWKVDLHLI